MECGCCKCQAGKSADEALEIIKGGHAEFLKSGAVNLSRERREETSKGQKPYAVIVTCSDSRVPPEHIFGAGIGDIFVVRTAGNVIGDFELGSVEYAVAHLGAKLIVVMGHTSCGAVTAAMDFHPEGNITKIMEEIKPCIGDEKDSNAAICKNTQNSIVRIKASEIIQKKLEEGDVKLLSCMYDIQTGAIDW